MTAAAQVSPDRIAPNDRAAERAVLGALILSGTPNQPGSRYYDDILATGITAADYYLPNHSTIHDAIAAVRDAGRPVDPVTLADELRHMGELDRIGGPVYLVDLVGEATAAASGEHYARIVRAEAYKRHVLAGARRVQQLVADSGGDRDAIEQALTEIITGIPGVQAAPPSVGDLLDGFLDHLEEVQDGRQMGIPYGYADLDDLTAGMRPGNVTVIAAQSGIGKSTLALNIATNAAKHGAAVMFSSLEMSADEVMEKIIAAEGSVSLARLKHKAGMTEADWEKVRDVAPLIRGLRLHLDQPEGATLTDIASAARATKREHGLDVLVVDYLQLVEIETRAGANREQAVAAISRGLKNLSTGLECHVIALSQLNDDGLMRESRAIKNDASVLLKVVRPEDEANREGECDIQVEKNRFGAAGRAIPVTAQLHYSRFGQMGRA